LLLHQIAQKRSGDPSPPSGETRLFGARKLIGKGPNDDHDAHHGKAVVQSTFCSNSFESMSSEIA
jgi:hypothetical protein